VALGAGLGGVLGAGVAALGVDVGAEVAVVVVWAVELAAVVVEDWPSSLLEMGVQKYTPAPATARTTTPATAARTPFLEPDLFGGVGI